MVSIDEQIKIIANGADEIINPDDLRGKLKRVQKKGVPLTVKLGLDPTAQDIHLGHTELVTDIHPDDLENMTASLNAGDVNPRDIKMKLAREITAMVIKIMNLKLLIYMTAILFRLANLSL